MISSSNWLVKLSLVLALSFGFPRWLLAEETIAVNDVSFLMPPSKDSIPIAGSEARRPLLSLEIFSQFSDFIERGHPHRTAEEVYDELIVTGFRFDPCGPKYPLDWDLSRCAFPNIRVIAQVRTNGTVSNAALHMVFLLRPLEEIDFSSGVPTPKIRLDSAQRKKTIASILRMKSIAKAAGADTMNHAVGIHPIFENRIDQSNERREFIQEFEKLLLECCHEDRYFLTAVFFTDETSPDSALRNKWVWQKGNIDRSSGKISVRIGGIPGFDPGLKEQVLLSNRGLRSGASVQPRSTLPAMGVKNSRIEAILSETISIDKDSIREAVDATERLENPNLVTVSSDDCASCHVASSAREHASIVTSWEQIGRTLQYKFDADPALVQQLDEYQKLMHQTGGFRIMALGFLGGIPSISQRTVNESLQAAHVTNLLIQSAE